MFDINKSFFFHQKKNHRDFSKSKYHWAYKFLFGRAIWEDQRPMKTLGNQDAEAIWTT